MGTVLNGCSKELCVNPLTTAAHGWTGTCGRTRSKTAPPRTSALPSLVSVSDVYWSFCKSSVDGACRNESKTLCGTTQGNDDTLLSNCCCERASKE